MKNVPFFAILSQKAFLSLWLSQILSQFAANITLFILGIIVYQTTGSNTAVSGIFMAYGIPSVIFGLLAGTAVDYIDKRSIILYSCITRALLVAGMVFSYTNMPAVYVLLFLNAVITQFFIPAESTMIPRLVSEEQLVSANSLFSFAYYGSIAVGFIAAGPVVCMFGHAGSLVFLSVIYLIAWWFSLQLPKFSDNKQFWNRVKELSYAAIIRKFMNSLSTGLKYVRHSPILFDSVMLLTGTQIIIAMLSTLGPGFADRVMGIPVEDASLFIIGPVIIGILLGGVWVGNKGYTYSPAFLMNVGILGAGVVLGVVSLTVYFQRFVFFDRLFSNTAVIAIIIFLFFLLGVFNSMLDVPANSVLQKEAEGDMRGRVYGILGAFVGGVGILPVMVGGVLADMVGVGKVILILSAFIILYGVYRMKYNTLGK